jgi:hypothetical protein
VSGTCRAPVGPNGINSLAWQNRRLGARFLGVDCATRVSGHFDSGEAMLARRRGLLARAKGNIVGGGAQDCHRNRGAARAVRYDIAGNRHRCAFRHCQNAVSGQRTGSRLSQFDQRAPPVGKVSAFARLDHRRPVGGLIRNFDKSRLQQGARAANDDPAPVFIVGMLRSGATFAEQMLAAHAQVFAAGEPADADHYGITDDAGAAPRVAATGCRAGRCRLGCFCGCLSAGTARSGPRL